MVKDITKDKLSFLLITSLIFLLSCSLPSTGILPLPNIGYLPQNDGEKFGEQTLVINLPNGIKALTNLHINSSRKNPDTGEFEKFPDNLRFVLTFKVPNGQSLRLATDKVEFSSPEFSSPFVVNVNHMLFVYGLPWQKGKEFKEELFKIAMYELNPFEELEGCGTYDLEKSHLCCICSYGLVTEDILLKENLGLKEAPKNVTVYPPEIYINDKLHKIEPLIFEYSTYIELAGK